jgi:hypothetical protein
LGGEVWPKPFWLELACHFDVSLSDENHVARVGLARVHLIASPSNGHILIYTKVVDRLASEFFYEVFCQLFFIIFHEGNS